ncbi:MAG: tryptophan 2,3-dioxygenase family protein [Myxococcota bacterium]
MAKTDYEKYIRTDELFALMRPLDALVTHDELLFQVTHQTAELWMKVVLHDVRTGTSLLAQDRLVEAADLFQRAAFIEAHLTRQLEILERMPPKEYVAIRRTLGRGSGQESPGFNELLGMGDLIWPELEALLRRRSVEVVDILDDPTGYAELHALLRSLFELDEWFRSFRFAHFRLVERQIGAFVDSLKGAPAELLAHGMREHLLPELWAAVNAFTRRVKQQESQS